MPVHPEVSMDQQILTVAERLFLEKGFAMTSTTEIAKEAGCNQALVHYYFRTKARLFDAIFEKKFQLIIIPFISEQPEEAELDAFLRQLIESHFEILKSNPKIPVLFFNELLTNPARLEHFKTHLTKVQNELLQKIGRAIQSEVHRGRNISVKPLDLLITIFSLNVTLFLLTPLLQTGLNLSQDEINALWDHRKRENVRTILTTIRST
jgi:AcrR family transcriptional regulator